MEADVFPLIIVDVHRGLRFGLSLGSFDVRLDYVVLGADGHALGELSGTVGNQFPLRLFI